MSKTQNPLLSRKMEEKWPKMMNTEVLDMGGSCKPNEQINQISGRSRSSDEEGVVYLPKIRQRFNSHAN